MHGSMVHAGSTRVAINVRGNATTLFSTHATCKAAEGRDSNVCRLGLGQQLCRGNSGNNEQFTSRWHLVCLFLFALPAEVSQLSPPTNSFLRIRKAHLQSFKINNLANVVACPALANQDIN